MYAPSRPLHRHYRYCPHCSHYSFPVDVILGINTPYTERLQRIAARCSGLWSYRLAAETLQELCGIHLSHTTIGELAGQTAGKIAERMQNNTDLRKDFQKAQG